MGFLARISEALRKSEERNLYLERLKEEIETLSEDEWDELLVWMEGQLEDIEIADPDVTGVRCWY